MTSRPPFMQYGGEHRSTVANTGGKNVDGL